MKHIHYKGDGVKQTRIESLIEVVINIFLGWCISMLITIYLIVPLWNLDWSLADSFWVTVIYTVAAIIRGYLVRRFFNAELHKAAHALARRFV